MVLLRFFHKMGLAAGDIINVAFGIFLSWSGKLSFVGRLHIKPWSPVLVGSFCETGLGWVHSGWSSMIWDGCLVFGGGYLFCLLCLRGKTGRER
ncbi:hypothetical protein GE21DRAFT_1004435 [Neurospora crassa]|nr:hypothetical protein GE21DRAFT_1004435 [Neurospora crassa]